MGRKAKKKQNREAEQKGNWEEEAQWREESNHSILMFRQSTGVTCQTCYRSSGHLLTVAMIFVQKLKCDIL